SVYVLEPNIKDGEGGLRDLHTAIWIVKTGYGEFDLKGLLAHGLASEEDIMELEDAREFLWKIRNDLHFHAGRKVDQLNFEAQERIAHLFSFEDHHTFLGVEDFMRQYYLHAGNIRHHASGIISRVSHRYENRGVVSKLREKRVDGDFSIYNGRLVLKSDDLFRRKPEKIMEVFEFRQGLGVELDVRTRELVCDNLSVLDELRGSYKVRDAFVKILNSEKRVFESLQMMHTLRVLARYIPEFSDITCRVQHDLYHIYTVDVHSLFAVRELEALRGEEGGKGFPFLSNLLEEIERPDLLFLSALFHDIGKGTGKGHAETGADMVFCIMDRMGFSEDDRDCVSFLVRHHLLLANLAQHRDLHDTKLIIDFAKTIGSVAKLSMLYLLTFADVRAIGPQVWTQWKAVLFHELYSKARNLLEKGTFEIAGVSERLEKTKMILYRIGADELNREIIDRYFERFPSRYLLSTRPEDIKLHIKVVTQLADKSFIIQTRHEMEKGYTEVLICTYDTHGLFSRITGVMASNNVNILGARINTSGDGVALDLLYVNSLLGEVITDERRWGKIKKDFKDVIEGRVKVGEMVKNMRPSILDRKFKPKVPTRVMTDNEVSDDFTVIDIYTQDRIGVLYAITSALSNLGLYIYISKITTKGDEATDIFYVKDIFGQKIMSEKKLEKIKTTLFESLENIL
ncbi:MAG: [protein-PII] uridylyltransferase, partial [Thermodesulfobacteriota bacterium]